MNSFFAQFIGFARLRPVVTACLVFSVIAGASNYWLWKRRDAVTQQHDQVRKNGEFMLLALTNRTHINADLGALRTALAQVDQNLADERSMEVNLGYFYKLERLTRVRLLRLNQLVSPVPPVGSPFKAVPFSIQFSGSYRNGMSFLRALETGPRILRIRDASLERSPGDTPDLIFELTVDVLAKL